MKGTTDRVLVTAATKHGATQEIAEALARDLRSASGGAVDVDCIPVRWDPSPATADGPALGSSMGRRSADGTTKVGVPRAGPPVTVDPSTGHR